MANGYQFLQQPGGGFTNIAPGALQMPPGTLGSLGNTGITGGMMGGLGQWTQGAARWTPPPGAPDMGQSVPGSTTILGSAGMGGLGPLGGNTGIAGAMIPSVGGQQWMHPVTGQIMAGGQGPGMSQLMPQVQGILQNQGLGPQNHPQPSAFDQSAQAGYWKFGTPLPSGLPPGLAQALQQAQARAQANPPPPATTGLAAAAQPQQPLPMLPSGWQGRIQF